MCRSLATSASNGRLSAGAGSVSLTVIRESPGFICWRGDGVTRRLFQVRLRSGRHPTGGSRGAGAGAGIGPAALGAALELPLRPLRLQVEQALGIAAQDVALLPLVQERQIVD